MAEDQCPWTEVQKVERPVIFKFMGEFFEISLEFFWNCMQYLLFQASHWSRSNGWDQFTKTKVSYKLVAKLFLCEHDVLFHFNPNWNWESLIEWIEWDLIFVGSCYCWSQIDIGGVRQYWTSICQVRSTTLQLWNNFLSECIETF